MLGATAGFIFTIIRYKELENLAIKKEKEGKTKKYQYQDGDLGVIKYDDSKEEDGDILTDSSDEEALLI